MEFRAATVEEIEPIVDLQQSCHLASMGDAKRSDGFLNTVLGADLLKAAIEEDAVFVAAQEGTVIAMAVCGSRAFWSCSQSLSSVASNLGSVAHDNTRLDRYNSYFWGVCMYQ